MATKILIVDKKTEVREFIADHVLRPHGYDPIKCDDLLEALMIAQTAEPTVILLDIQMPKLAGLKATDLVRQLRQEGSVIPLIFMTSESSRPKVTRAMRVGAADYLNKPFTPHELLNAIQNSLDRREQAQIQTELTLLNKAMLELLEEQKKLVKLGRNLISAVDLDQVLSEVMRVATRVTEAEKCSIMMLHEDNNELLVSTTTKDDDATARTFLSPHMDLLARQVVQTGAPVLQNRNASRELYSAARSQLYVPLKFHGQLIGVLSLDKVYDKRPFTDRDLRLMQTICDYAAIAIQNVRLTDRLGLEQLRSLTTDAKAIANKDIAKSIELLDKAYRVAKELPGGGQEKWGLIEDTVQSIPRLEAFVAASIDGYHSDSPLLLGKEHKLLVAVLKETPEGLAGQPVLLPDVDAIEIDVIVHATGMQVLPSQLKRIRYFQGRNSDTIEFELIPLEAGLKRIDIDFYHERHWLTQLTFSVLVAE